MRFDAKNLKEQKPQLLRQTENAFLLTGRVQAGLYGRNLHTE